ncbi:MAG: oligopeptidase B, partial [Candidatus Paceibacterota bacterium]
MKIPIAEKRPMRITAHGDTRVDEYAWLRDAGDPKAIQYIRDENAFADASMRPTRALQRQLYKEIRGRLKENDMSVPVKDGPYLYYSRTKKGKQYAIHCRKKVRGGREEVLLDENILAKGHTYFALGGAEVSPDHTLLAYTVNTTGDEKYTLLIKDLRTGALLRERIACVSDIEWAEDGSHFFYTVEEHPHPPRKAYLHRIGTHSSSDVLVYEETDPQWYVGLDKSGSDAFVFIIAANFNTTEVRLVPAKEPLTMPMLFAPRKKEVKYFAEHHKDSFYIMSNERAVNYAIYKTAITTPQKR